ncbi:hypothetical protein [Pseudacidovorax sp. NFM-22]|uniref:hypothetical protein n=1 Tax=Pseudacidovorax sp. NFM-22 TaxID=2744469 RepID=UPI001F314119|nr:hypothetical protein [Pseudacidovorax sp. NFM-22]
MIVIPAIEVDGVLRPSEPYPENCIEIRCNGITYTVYEPGDDVPMLPGAAADDPLPSELGSP